MKYEHKIAGKTIYLRILQCTDTSAEYLRWMEDSEVNQYLESRHSSQNMESIRAFIQKMLESPTNYLFGIFSNDTHEHIGNIKLGDISDKYSRGDIGLLIGNRNYWGKGIGSEAIGLISDFGFNTLKLHKVFAGAYASNVGSIKAFQKNGFVIEGKFKDHYRLPNGEWEDSVILSKIQNT